MSINLKCSCIQRNPLVEITDGYHSFTDTLNTIEFGNWVKLMQCSECLQYWKLDEWDKYQTLYAVKIQNKDNWEKYDGTSLIKARIIQNRGGLESVQCLWENCGLNAVRASAYCVDHLYDNGARS
ncbi:hypothetical protein [Undibacterium sp. Ren11W]|uniref:hypothetical protein n=1 Tax=Undibacterium sp. Ren11W TaxID=3413045 RepID=UPI003BF30189